MAIIANILLVIFVPICILLILVVLLQSGKGGGLSGAFGGAGAQPFLGARGTADFLSKLTIYLAIGFISLALILSITYGPSRSFRVKEEAPAVTTEDKSSEKGSAETKSSSNEQKTNQPQKSGNTSNTPKPSSGQ
ncbi:MAG: preprotein translocase subunit SecG [bacterium]